MSGLGPAPWTPGHHARGSAGQGSRDPRPLQTAGPTAGWQSHRCVSQARRGRSVGRSDPRTFQCSPIDCGHKRGKEELPEG